MYASRIITNKKILSRNSFASAQVRAGMYKSYDNRKYKKCLWGVLVTSLVNVLYIPPQSGQWLLLRMNMSAGRKNVCVTAWNNM